MKTLFIIIALSTIGFLSFRLSDYIESKEIKVKTYSQLEYAQGIQKTMCEAFDFDFKCSCLFTRLDETGVNIGKDYFKYSTLYTRKSNTKLLIIGSEKDRRTVNCDFIECEIIKKEVKPT